MTSNCGVPAHDETCLCDVEIVDPAPVNYRLDEVLHADYIINQLGISRPWTPDKLARVGEALCAATDAIAEVKERMKDRQLDQDRPATYTPVVRELLAQGHSITDVPTIVGTSFDFVVQALFPHRPTKVLLWNKRQWLDFEGDLLNGRGSWWLSRHHEIPQTTCQRLVRVYRGLPAAAHGGKAAS